jgi:hypothetical protein
MVGFFFAFFVFFVFFVVQSLSLSLSAYRSGNGRAALVALQSRFLRVILS